MGVGYTDQRTGKTVVRVCASCPDKEQADQQARNAGQLVSHGLCFACFEKQMTQIFGRKVHL
jgi:hypothetical protein